MVIRADVYRTSFTQSTRYFNMCRGKGMDNIRVGEQVLCNLGGRKI
jgi:hypothetical protein